MKRQKNKYEFARDEARLELARNIVKVESREARDSVGDPTQQKDIQRRKQIIRGLLEDIEKMTIMINYYEISLYRDVE